MTVQIFGQRFDAPAFDDATLIRTPIGHACIMCGEPVAAGDSGVMMPCLLRDADRVALEPEHIECHLRSVLGSVDHLCANGSCLDHDRSSLPYREQARQTMAWIVERKVELGHPVWLAHL